MCEQFTDRRSPIAVIRGAIRLKAVDADFTGRVKVPARVAPKRLNVTVIAFGFAAEELIAASCCGWIEAPGGRLGRRYCQLIELKSLELGRDQVVIGADMFSIGKPQVSKAVSCGNRKLYAVRSAADPRIYRSHAFPDWPRTHSNAELIPSPSTYGDSHLPVQMRVESAKPR